MSGVFFRSKTIVSSEESRPSMATKMRRFKQKFRDLRSTFTFSRKQPRDYRPPSSGIDSSDVVWYSSSPKYDTLPAEFGLAASPLFSSREELLQVGLLSMVHWFKLLMRIVLYNAARRDCCMPWGSPGNRFAPIPSTSCISTIPPKLLLSETSFLDIIVICRDIVYPVPDAVVIEEVVSSKKKRCRSRSRAQRARSRQRQLAAHNIEKNIFEELRTVEEDAETEEAKTPIDGDAVQLETVEESKAEPARTAEVKPIRVVLEVLDNCDRSAEKPPLEHSFREEAYLGEDLEMLSIAIAHFPSMKLFRKLRSLMAHQMKMTPCSTPEVVSVAKVDTSRVVAYTCTFASDSAPRSIKPCSINTKAKGGRRLKPKSLGYAKDTSDINAEFSKEQFDRVMVLLLADVNRLPSMEPSKRFQASVCVQKSWWSLMHTVNCALTRIGAERIISHDKVIELFCNLLGVGQEYESLKHNFCSLENPSLDNISKAEDRAVLMTSVLASAQAVYEAEMAGGPGLLSYLTDAITRLKQAKHLAWAIYARLCPEETDQLTEICEEFDAQASLALIDLDSLCRALGSTSTEELEPALCVCKSLSDSLQEGVHDLTSRLRLMRELLVGLILNAPETARPWKKARRRRRRPNKKS